MQTKTKIRMLDNPDFDKLVNKISSDYKQKKEEIIIKNSVRKSLKSTVQVTMHQKNLQNRLERRFQFLNQLQRASAAKKAQGGS